MHYTSLLCLGKVEVWLMFFQWLQWLQWGVTFSQVAWLIGC
jgi:hypothetical protein